MRPFTWMRRSNAVHERFVRPVFLLAADLQDEDVAIAVGDDLLVLPVAVGGPLRALRREEPDVALADAPEDPASGIDVAVERLPRAERPFVALVERGLRNPRVRAPERSHCSPFGLYIMIAAFFICTTRGTVTLPSHHPGPLLLGGRA